MSEQGFRSGTIYPSFAPIPPEEHIIRAKDILELYLKLKRWFCKYGYELK